MRTDRQLAIIMLLLEGRRISAPELAARFEVSPRTVYRDIESICMSGIPIRAVAGIGGGYEIMPGFRADSTVFSTSELQTLLAALSALSGVVSPEEAASAEAKLRALLPDRSIEPTDAPVLIDLCGWSENPRTRTSLQLLRTAIRDAHTICFNYIDSHARRTSRRVEPYRLILKGSSWYLQGFCLERQDGQLFRLNRMLDLRITAERFPPRPLPPPVTDAAALLDALLTTVRIRFHSSILDRVLGLCPPEQIFPDEDGMYLADHPFRETDWWYDRLLSLGPMCEIISPPAVRRELGRRLRDMAALYPDD